MLITKDDIWQDVSTLIIILKLMELSSRMRKWVLWVLGEKDFFTVSCLKLTKVYLTIAPHLVSKHACSSHNTRLVGDEVAPQRVGGISLLKIFAQCSFGMCIFRNVLFRKVHFSLSALSECLQFPAWDQPLSPAWRRLRFPAWEHLQVPCLGTFAIPACNASPKQPLPGNAC